MARSNRIITGISMKKLTLIFDFDGTIADTLHAIKHIMCEIYAECGLGEIKEEDIERMRGMSAREAVKKLGIPWWKIPSLLKRGKAELSANIEKLLPISGIGPALGKLKAEGHKLYIVSSNSKENIERFLENHGLTKTFDDIHSDSGLWGKSGILKKLIKKESLAPGEALYVGDEIRDIEATRKAGIGIIAVSWGFNTEAALQKHNPDYVARKPEDLIEIANGIKALL